MTAAWTAAFVAFILYFPWEDIRGRFDDLHTYRYNFMRGVYQLYSASGVFNWWQQEALWKWGLPQLAYSVGGFDRALRLATAFAAISTSAYVVIRCGSAIYLPLLISPLYIDLVYSQVRSAVAIGLLYIATLLFRSKLSSFTGVAPAAASIFIHNFAVVPLALGGFFKLVQRAPQKLNSYLKYGLIFGAILAVAFALTAKREDLLLAIRDRRLLQRQDTSGIVLTMLLFSLTLPIWLRPRELLKHVDAPLLATAGILLGSFYVSGIQGGPRLMAFALPALAVIISEISDRRTRAIVYGYTMLVHMSYFSVWGGFL